MSVYPDQIIIEIYTTSWIDVSADVIGPISGNYGILSSNKLDRIADVGDLSFTLRNDVSCLGGVNNYYTPQHANSLSGWERGINVRLRIQYNPELVTKWYGHISDIDINVEERTVTVTALDFMDYFSNYRLNVVNVANDQSLSDVVDVILSGMAIQPLSKTHYGSVDSFTSAFDTLRNDTIATTELVKLALSEFGWIYIRHGDITYDEILVTEGRAIRNFASSSKALPYNDIYILDENETILLTENGDGIILNLSQNVIYASNMIDVEMSYGDDLANRIVVKAYPRRVDTSNQVLFSLGTDIIPLSGSETKTVIGEYRDPNQKAESVAGKDMVSPVATTDYQMWSGSWTGGGDDLTAYLSVTENYYANNVEYTLENTSGSYGYVTVLQARGIGIYIDSALTYAPEDATSIAKNGPKELTLDQKYQSNPYVGQILADQILEQLKNPTTRLDSVSFLANTSDELMRSFLFNDIGSLIYLTDENYSNVDNYFYINGIEFEINPGGIIKYTWILSDAKTLDNVYWIVGTSLVGISTIVGY